MARQTRSAGTGMLAAEQRTGEGATGAAHGRSSLPRIIGLPEIARVMDRLRSYSVKFQPGLRARLTRRWRKPATKLYNPLTFETGSGSFEIPKVEFAADSPLEGDGFEPSVPQQIRSRFRESRVAWRFDRLATRNRKFESISLQRGVCCEPDSLEERHLVCRWAKSRNNAIRASCRVITSFRGFPDVVE
jgi:hypothetical protein